MIAHEDSNESHPQPLSALGPILLQKSGVKDVLPVATKPRRGRYFRQPTRGGSLTHWN
jgi:hypothetical protein